MNDDWIKWIESKKHQILMLSYYHHINTRYDMALEKRCVWRVKNKACDERKKQNEREIRRMRIKAAWSWSLHAHFFFFSSVFFLLFLWMRQFIKAFTLSVARSVECDHLPWDVYKNRLVCWLISEVFVPIWGQA